MKLNTQNIVWFERPVKQGKLTATLGSNQKLILSDELKKQLPENIQFGFDAGSRILVIAESANPKNKKCKNGIVFGLLDEILSTGMKLPVCFEFEFNEENKLWVGQVVLRRKRQEYDLEQVLALYKPIADKLFIQIGKTTPREDRRQIINLAMCEAVKEYTPAHGDFEKFITRRVKDSLKLKNSHYVKHGMDRSMDAAITDSENSGYNLYSVTKHNESGYEKVETKIMNEQFEEQLTDKELAVFRLLKQRIKLDDIAEELSISAESVEILAKSTAMKRRHFYSQSL